MKMVYLGVVVLLAACAQNRPAAQDKWVMLFNGKNLDGWTQMNGTATYRIEDGAIIGQTTPGSPNSFLCTDKLYGNFELRFEVKLISSRLNSGVQIRSKAGGALNAKKQPKGDRINGPQIEIEASGEKGAEAGYIYGEATGLKWLTPPDRLIPHKVFKDQEWNTFRVLAEGPRIRTWINGKPIEDLTHEVIYKTHPTGVIGLQVHGVKKEIGPFQVAWRNIRIREIK